MSAGGILRLLKYSAVVGGPVAPEATVSTYPPKSNHAYESRQQTRDKKAPAHPGLVGCFLVSGRNGLPARACALSSFVGCCAWWARYGTYTHAWNR